MNDCFENSHQRFHVGAGFSRHGRAEARPTHDRGETVRTMCDLVLFNANVISMDPSLPRAGLVGIRGNRIALVGDSGMLDDLKHPGVQTIDCGRRTILPGFVDAHCHVFAYAESLVSFNLSRQDSIHSISDIQRKIQDSCSSIPPGTWIRGKGFNEFAVREGRFLNCRELDVVAPRHPVKITHRSGHAHILNSLALARTNITEETGDPPGGLIDRDGRTGRPTGILYAMGSYLAQKIPPLDEAEMKRGMELANEKLLSYGITSVQDASSANDRQQWEQFVELKSRGILQPRLTMMMGLKGFAESRQAAFLSTLEDIDLKPGGVKIMADRATGNLYPDQKELNERVLEIHAAGCQVVIHAVETPVIEAACSAIAYALKKIPRRYHRHRIEHCSVCPPALLGKIAGLGITVVTQPSFIYYSGDRYLKTVPGDQIEHLYAIGSMLGRRLPVGFSSDFPISGPNPLVGVCAAVTRFTEENRSVQPKQGIGLEDALKMYTLDAAAAGFEEKIKGSITPGKVADLIMLDKDPFAVPSGSVKDIRVLMTMIGGRIVWGSAD